MICEGATPEERMASSVLVMKPDGSGGGGIFRSGSLKSSIFESTVKRERFQEICSLAKHSSLSTGDLRQDVVHGTVNCTSRG
jgi:hypothetical protein